VITFVIFASGLKYVGLQTEALGWTLCAVLLGVAGGWLAWKRPWRALGAQTALATDGSAEAALPELAIAEAPGRPDGE
jgi:hypothetical protein